MKSNTKLQILTSLMLVLIVCAACDTDYSKRYLEEALELAGDNRQELEKGLDHYSGNPEKYEAACWLIANMPKFFAFRGAVIEIIP